LKVIENIYIVYKFKEMKSKISIFLLVTLIQCTPKITPYKSGDNYIPDDSTPDYSKLMFWAAHPDKWDPSDSVPAPLIGTKKNIDADVFFLHPTTLTDKSDIIPTNALLSDGYINKKTDYTSILYQASVFNECKIYAPRYRQAHLQMYYETDSGKSRKAFELAYSDIKDAFKYYLTNFNKGRPIIIASHSQGTTHAKRLMTEFFDKNELSKKLIAGYLIGIPVEKNLYLSIPLCTDSLSTGCVMSWRTFREGYRNNLNTLNDSSVLVTNPVIWTLSPETANRSEAKGAVLYNFNKVYSSTHRTTIRGNILEISKPKFPGSFLYNVKNYHAGDINLFYLDIRMDVRRRYEQYIKSTQ
jgi:hypothetical protein